MQEVLSQTHSVLKDIVHEVVWHVASHLLEVSHISKVNFFCNMHCSFDFFVKYLVLLNIGKYILLWSESLYDESLVPEIYLLGLMSYWINSFCIIFGRIECFVGYLFIYFLMLRSLHQWNPIPCGNKLIMLHLDGVQSFHFHPILKALLLQFWNSVNWVYIWAKGF